MSEKPTTSKNNQTTDKKTAESKTQAVVSDSLVLALGGKQYVAHFGDKLLVERIKDQTGEIKTRDLLSGKDVLLKAGEEKKGEKILMWKYKNKSRQLKRRGHRQTYLQVTVEKFV